MKKINFLIFFVILLISQNVTSQINLDEVVITKNKTNCNNTVSTKSLSEVDNIRYYYYPNLEAYYDFNDSKYILKRYGEWVRVDKIPPRYRGYSLFNDRYVILKGVVCDNPQDFISDHKKMYPCNYKGYSSERIVANK